MPELHTLVLYIIWFSATLGAGSYYTHLTERQALQIQTAKRWQSWGFHPGLLESELQTFPPTPCWIHSLSFVLTKLPKLQMFGSLDISNKCRRYWGCSGIPPGEHGEITRQSYLLYTFGKVSFSSDNSPIWSPCLHTALPPTDLDLQGCASRGCFEKASRQSLARQGT